VLGPLILSYFCPSLTAFIAFYAFLAIVESVSYVFAIAALVRLPLASAKNQESFEGCDAVLKARINNEWRQPARLTDHFALIADAALAFVCESLHACENRIGVEMRFRDHVRFEAAASPGIVEVGRE